MTPLSVEEQNLLNGIGPHPWLFDVSLPSGTVYWSKIGYTSKSLSRSYQGLIKSVSYPEYGASDYGGNTPSSSMSFDLNDATKQFATQYKNREDELKGLSVLVRQAHPTKLPADWFTTFTGVIEKVEWPELMTPRFSLRMDDSVIKHKSPKGYTRTILTRWPNASPDALNGYARIVYGTHDSLGFTGQGFVPLDLIDRTNYWYGPILGRIMDVMRVYANDKIQLAANRWSWGYAGRRGTWYTVVTLTVDAYADIYNVDGATAWTDADAAGKADMVRQTKISVDCRGLGTSPLGNTSGSTLIVNPIEQCVHYLTNFVIGSWRRGAWLMSSRIGTYSELQDFFSSFSIGFKGAKVISDVNNGDSYLADWLKTFAVDALAMTFWNADGKLYFRLVPITDPNIYVDGPISFQQSLILESPDIGNTITELTYEYVKDDSHNKFITNVTSRDPSASEDEDVPEHFSQEWGSAE